MFSYYITTEKNCNFYSNTFNFLRMLVLFCTMFYVKLCIKMKKREKWSMLRMELGNYSLRDLTICERSEPHTRNFA